LTFKLQANTSVTPVLRNVHAVLFLRLFVFELKPVCDKRADKQTGGQMDGPTKRAEQPIRMAA